MRKIKIIFIINIFSIVTSFLFVDYIGDKFNSVLKKYINIEVKRFTTNVVNTSVNDVILNKNTDDLFIVNKNSKQELETIDVNTKYVNKILKEVNLNIKDKLKSLEEGKIKDLNVSDVFKTSKYKKIRNGVLCELPLSLLKNNVTLSNIGPTIPIKLSFSGNVKSKTTTKIKSYGINNLVIEIIIIVEINEQITMPTSSDETTLIIEAPLIVKIIQGKVPDYYETDLNGNSITSTIFPN